MIYSQWKQSGALTAAVCLVAVGMLHRPALAKDSEHPRGFVDGSSFAAMADENDRLIEVTLSGSMLKMATGVIGHQVDGAAELLDGIRSVHAVVVGVDDESDRAKKLIAKMSNQLKDDGWEQLARVREDDVHLAVFVLPADDGAIDGITVVVADKGDETLVFANIAGRIDLEAVAQIGMNLNIPGLERLKGHSFKSEVKKYKKKSRKSEE